MDRSLWVSSAQRVPTAIRVTDTNAQPTVIPRGQIAQIRPSGTSIMPVGLAAMLGDPAVRDLIAYLTGGRATSSKRWRSAGNSNRQAKA